MERLTIPDIMIGEKTKRRTIIDASEVRKHAVEFYWHLKSIEDILGDDYDLDRLRELLAACKGLEPSEIAESKLLIATRKDPEKLARMAELVEADRDGRCVVLPCKVGDSVWVTMAYGKQYNPPVHGHVHKFVLHDDEIVYLESIIWMDIGDGGKGYGYTEKSFGKAVFLTREAAEAALKES